MVMIIEIVNGCSTNSLDSSETVIASPAAD